MYQPIHLIYFEIKKVIKMWNFLHSLRIHDNILIHSNSIKEMFIYFPKVFTQLLRYPC